ncbi:sulfate transmembrane transporter [Actinidia rufa]|uniref:Sulfate transmembrane transporter n=1 Tax=Actinidia rufa TaxID=165716 RepID=A0A7J0H6A0_9ERIC|nr:sulfate transmembrane transporter [Actinidia rufa]
MAPPPRHQPPPQDHHLVGARWSRGHLGTYIPLSSLPDPSFPTSTSPPPSSPPVFETTHLSTSQIAVAGISTVAILLLLGTTGLMSIFYKVIPLPVVRGVQVSQGLLLPSPLSNTSATPKIWPPKNLVRHGPGLASTVSSSPFSLSLDDFEVVFASEFDRDSASTGIVRAKAIITPELSLFRKFGRIVVPKFGQETTADEDPKACQEIEGNLHNEVSSSSSHAWIKT